MLELLIVLGVIGMIVMFTLLTYPSGRRRARDTQRRSDLKQYQTALETYADRNSGLYPVGSGDMVDVCVTTPLDVTSCPESPSGNKYSYEGTLTSYFLYAELEQDDKDDNTQYYVICSNGLSDDTASSPPYVNCPI